MDAWETLLDNSTIADTDAWEHLNNQSGEGGGDGETVFLIGPATAECNHTTSATISTILSSTVSHDTLTANINESLSATIKSGFVTCEV